MNFFDNSSVQQTSEEGPLYSNGEYVQQIRPSDAQDASNDASLHWDALSSTPPQAPFEESTSATNQDRLESLDDVANFINELRVSSHHFPLST